MVDGTALGAPCGLHWACTVVHPALSIIVLLPTPQLCTAAFLAVLCTEVHRRSGKEHPVISSVCLPATEVISIDAMASVDTVVCGAGSATTTALRPPGPRHTPRASST